MNFNEILSLFRQGKATVKSHIKNLIQIAAADGNFGLDEQALLVSIANRNNISQKLLQKIKSNPSDIPFEIPASEREKFQQLYDLAHMMSIDKTIHHEEQRLCELFAVRFQYPPSRAKELVERIRLILKIEMVLKRL